MLSRRQQRLARMRQAVDGACGEYVRIIPMVSGQYTGQVSDENRSDFEVVALLTIGKGETEPRDTGKRMFHIHVPAGKAKLVINTETIPVGNSIKKGDHIQALERDGEPVFEIVRVDEHQIGRMVLQLGEVS